MNIKIVAVSALVLTSYLSNISVASAAVEVPDSAVAVAPVADVDTIGASSYTDLEDFVIVEHKKLVQSDGAKLTYNVTEDPEAGNSNILDILRKVPGITVDAEDNVKVNGQSSFKILMNGHEDPMLRRYKDSVEIASRGLHQENRGDIRTRGQIRGRGCRGNIEHCH